jgi:general secretion pathway protein J
MSRRQRTAFGFTLIEMVVTLAVMSLLSVAVLSVFQFSQRGFEQVVRHRNADSQTQQTVRFLRRAIENAYPLEAESRSAAYSYGLEGEADHIEFTSLAPASFTVRGHLRYEVGVQRTLDGQRNLVVRVSVDRVGVDSVRARNRVLAEEILLENIESFRWSYLDAGRTSDGRRTRVWRDNWIAQRRLPQAVRLEVAFAPEDPRRWPSFLAATRITDDAQCAFDVVSLSCRESFR